MKPVTMVLYGTPIDGTLENRRGECAWADHETRATGQIGPHWHCAGFEAGRCWRLHGTKPDAEMCPMPGARERIQ